MGIHGRLLEDIIERKDENGARYGKIKKIEKTKVTTS
jgi:hypothetical protein